MYISYSKEILTKTLGVLPFFLIKWHRWHLHRGRERPLTCTWGPPGETGIGKQHTSHKWLWQKRQCQLACRLAFLKCQKEGKRPSLHVTEKSHGRADGLGRTRSTREPWSQKGGLGVTERLWHTQPAPSECRGGGWGCRWGPGGLVGTSGPFLREHSRTRASESRAACRRKGMADHTGLRETRLGIRRFNS